MSGNGGGAAARAAGEEQRVRGGAAAQNAGAVGVVFANNDEDNADAVVDMGGDTVHVPVVMISHSEGERAIGLGAGAPVAIAGLDVEIDTYRTDGVRDSCSPASLKPTDAALDSLIGDLALGPCFLLDLEPP